MKENNYGFQKNLFSNLQLNIIISAYTHCWSTWQYLDYIPDYNKFYFIIEGEGWLKIGEQEFYPKPGQLFLMPAGVQQSYTVINDNTFKKYWCHFTATIGDVNLFDIIKTPYFLDVSENKKVESLFVQLIKEQDSHELHSLLREKALLLELLSYFIENAKAENMKFSNSPTMDRLNTVLKYIDEHTSDNITVEKLAQILHFHPNYFTKVFKKYIGMSPIQYIGKVKLEKAKYLLKATNMQVSEVAEKTGFCDIYHFSKTFKAYTGFSPSEYRVI